MNTTMLQSKILKCIQSKALLNAIKEQNIQFPSKELMAIAYTYAESYKQRLDFLILLKEHSRDQELKIYLEKLIAVQENTLKSFLEPQNGCVYELHIKEEPNAYDERYLCSSYKSALEMIPLFYKRYGDTETDAARYSIIKRKIFGSAENKKFDEDYIGACYLKAGSILRDVDMEGIAQFANECDVCYDDKCEKLCINNIDIHFPVFIQDKELVKYPDYYGALCYGVNLEITQSETDEYYVIPLDCSAMKYRDFERDFYNHKHIKAPYIEPASTAEIRPELQNIYSEYLDYLNKHGR
uniref:Uncharacterized protein n=1 Tax=uncultured Bacillota bacterium TaxID=344338 RepID=A0A650EPM5_9FIRM|nr:hypothetical protein Firmicute1046_2740 [uncultured Firmicutes bacterium]